MGKLRGEVAAALHEAPFDPTFWPHALEATARACGASSAQLLGFGGCRFSPIIAPGFTSDDIAAFVALQGADPTVNHGLRAVLSSPLHAIVSDAEYISDGQRRLDPLYNEFFCRFDGHYIASGTVARNPAAVCNLNLFLPARSGGLGANARRTLQDLLPLFTQALRLATRLEATAATLAGDAWDARGDAVMICDANGSILHASREAERMLSRHALYQLRGRWPKSFDAATAMRIEAAIRMASDPVAPSASHIVAASAHGARLVLDVVPVPSSLLRVAPNVLVLLQELDRTLPLDRARLVAAFRLTPAECEVADGLMRRLSSAEIARLRGVSVETVSTQVKALLAKTGAADRGKLTLLLQGYTRRPRSEH